MGSTGWDLGQQAGTWANRLKFRPMGWDLGQWDGIWANRLGFGPTGWDLGQQDGIWANRLLFGTTSWNLGFKSWRGGRTDLRLYVMVHPRVLQDIGLLGSLPKKQRKKKKKKNKKKKTKQNEWTETAARRDKEFVTSPDLSQTFDKIENDLFQ